MLAGRRHCALRALALPSSTGMLAGRRRLAACLLQRRDTGKPHRVDRSDTGRSGCCTLAKGWNVGACTDLLVSAYNHLWDASISALLVNLLVYSSWSTTIQGMRLSVERWCMYGSIGPDLQSSMASTFHTKAAAVIYYDANS